MLTHLSRHARRALSTRTIAAPWSGMSAEDTLHELDSLAGRSLLTLADLDTAQLASLLRLSRSLRTFREANPVAGPKSYPFGPERASGRNADGSALASAEDGPAAPSHRPPPRVFEGLNLPMLFEKRSTRTRVSTEVAMASLGGHALFLGSNDIQLGTSESLEDTGAVLGALGDAIFARVSDHGTLTTLEKTAGVPVINGLSELFHPLQILADLEALTEHFGGVSGLRVAWVGDANNILCSYLAAAPQLGVSVTAAVPECYPIRPEVLSHLSSDNNNNNNNNNRSVARSPIDLYGSHPGASLRVVSDPREAVSGADVVVTDTWISMGDEAEAAERLGNFAGYQVGDDLMRLAAEDAVFLHCMPRKKEECTDSVFYAPNSLVLRAAENRRYTVQAVLVAALGRARALVQGGVALVD